MIHATIDSTDPKSAVAALFEAAGWKVRRCTWVDFELRSESAELILEAGEPMLLHGPALAEVVPTGERIAAVLRAARLQFAIECYDRDQKLIHTVRG